MTDPIPAETLAHIRAGVMAEIRLVCVICHDFGFFVSCDDSYEYCDCARGEALEHAMEREDDEPW